MSSTALLLIATSIGLGYSQPIQQPKQLSTSSDNRFNICLSIINSTLQTLNVTFERQAYASTNQPFDLSILPNDCFYLQSPQSTCQRFPPELNDLFSMITWVTQLIQKCNFPGSWAGYPSTLLNVNQATRQFSASIGTSAGSASPSGSLGISGSVGSTGTGLGGSVSMGSNGQGNGGYGGYGAQGVSGMMNTGASGAPVMVLPVQAGIGATPLNPFSTMMNIIGSSVGPQGLTISPATIAGILQLINQVVGIAVSLAPVGGAIAGPLLGAALG